MVTSMHKSSLVSGSTARRRVVSVVSARLFPQGMVDEKANGPAVIGQYVRLEFSTDGSGDGGRRVEHRYELFVHAFNVRTDVDVKRVALREFEVSGVKTPSYVGQTYRGLSWY